MIHHAQNGLLSSLSRIGSKTTIHHVSNKPEELLVSVGMVGGYPVFKTRRGEYTVPELDKESRFESKKEAERFVKGWLKENPMRNPSLSAGGRPHIVHPDGKITRVTNLGWLLKNWMKISRLTWETTEHGSGVFRADMEDGSVYTTDYADFGVFRRFVDRPVFRDLDIYVDGKHFKVGSPAFRELRAGYERNPKSPSEMSAGEINKNLDRLDAKLSALNNRMIEEGWGHYRPSEFPASHSLTAEYKSLHEQRDAYARERDRRYGPGAPSRLPVGRGFGPIKRFNPEGVELLLYGIAKGDTERWQEQLLYSKAKTQSDIEKIKTIAAKDGFHSFRVTTYDGSAPDFTRVLGRGKRNPEAEAAEVYESFHGSPSENITDISETVHEHEYLAQLGTLVSITLETESGYSATLKFNRTGASRVELASSEDCTSMYFVGGDQSVDLPKLHMGGDKWKKDLMVLGRLKEIEYFTEKKFDNFAPTVYYHKSREGLDSSGTKHVIVADQDAVVLYDSRSKLLSLAGGQYKVEDVGVVG